MSINIYFLRSHIDFYGQSYTNEKRIERTERQGETLSRPTIKEVEGKFVNYSVID